MRDSQLFDLLQHCEWADSALWRAVVAADVADEKTVGWLHHVHLVQHAFFTVWSGGPLDLEHLPKPEDHEDLASMMRWAQDCHRELQEYLVECDEVDLGRELTLPWAARMEAEWHHPLQPVTLQQSMHQVVLHSAHHRAQVSSRLRSLSFAPPPIDYIIWLWRDRPAPEWPENPS
ncbi:MAG: hypothetical protein MPN21_16105 [Thermoanaerobaculia bacterium]|nr:hypothetical protein [Thermoanaerobaculia bacterium]